LEKDPRANWEDRPENLETKKKGQESCQLYWKNSLAYQLQDSLTTEKFLAGLLGWKIGLLGVPQKFLF
jgi:hypothetical protein